VRAIDIDHEMQQPYLSYAMSVIVRRALPATRVTASSRCIAASCTRCTIWACSQLALQEVARIVGEVLGQVSPARRRGGVAMPCRAWRRISPCGYLLVDGQGNFRLSVDGDAPAAMRYTEARLAKMATDLLGDIEKNTVDFTANFDGTLKEPNVLPAAVPNLLVNRGPPASPSAWRPTSRRTTWARCARRSRI